MASKDGSKQIDPADSTRRARTAAEQRQEKAATSDDPEVLTAEIERTREELAETIDAIADKVSPKRVTARTKKKVGDAVKDGAESATATVKAASAQLKDAVSEKTEQLSSTVSGDDSADQGPVVGVAPAAVRDPLAPPGLHPVPPPSAGTSPGLGAPALLGAAAAALLALLVLRRRRRR